MITTQVLGEGFFPVLCWSAVCWIAGVAWAAYRAVGWADRMRQWAQTCEVDVDDDREPVA